MSQRTVWSCDICGKDCLKEDVRAFNGLTAREHIDVGKCCWGEPISDLIDAFARVVNGNGKAH